LTIRPTPTSTHFPYTTLFRSYSFPTLGSYNALLSLFNIIAEEVKVERNGQTVNGLVYVALDKNGNKAGHPFKASLFGKDAGIAQDRKSTRLNSSHVKISYAVF